MSLRAKALQAYQDAKNNQQARKIEDLMEALRRVGLGGETVEVIETAGRLRAQVGDITAFHLYFDYPTNQLCVCGTDGILHSDPPYPVSTLADLGLAIGIYEHYPR